jgi:hypothetical protein
VDKGISFLMLCRVEGEDRLVKGNCFSRNGLEGYFIAVTFRNWVE